MRPTLTIALAAAALLGACRDRPQPVTGHVVHRRVVTVYEPRPVIPGAIVSAPSPAMVVVPMASVVQPLSLKP